MNRSHTPLLIVTMLLGLAALSCNLQGAGTSDAVAPDPTTPPPGITPTPTVQSPADPGTCSITATRTPPPGAPTYGPDPSGSSEQPRYVDPHVEVCSSADAIPVGGFLTIVGQPVDVGLPVYTLRVRDESEEGFADLVRVSYNGEIEAQFEDASRVFEFVSAEADMHRVTFVLYAAAPGVAEFTIYASGEIHYGYPGPAEWSGAGSESVAISVTE